MFDERKYALIVEVLAYKAWTQMENDAERARAAASEVVAEYRSHTMTFMEAASILNMSDNSEAGFAAGLDSVVHPDHTKSFVVDAAEAALVEDVAQAVLDIYAPGAAEEPVSTLEEDIAAMAPDMRMKHDPGLPLCRLLEVVQYEAWDNGHVLRVRVQAADHAALLAWIKNNACDDGWEALQRFRETAGGSELYTPRSPSDWNDLYEWCQGWCTDWFDQVVWEVVGREELLRRGLLQAHVNPPLRPLRGLTRHHTEAACPRCGMEVSMTDWLNGQDFALAELATRAVTRAGLVPNYEYRLYVGDEVYARCPRCLGQQRAGAAQCPRCAGTGISETISLDELCASRWGCSFLDLLRQPHHPRVRATSDRPDLLALAQAYDGVMSAFGMSGRAEVLP